MPDATIRASKRFALLAIPDPAEKFIDRILDGRSGNVSFQLPQVPDEVPANCKRLFLFPFSTKKAGGLDQLCRRSLRFPARKQRKK